MLGIKSQPLDGGEVPLLMSSHSCQGGGAKMVSCATNLASQKEGAVLHMKNEKYNGNGCVEKKKRVADREGRRGSSK